MRFLLSFMVLLMILFSQPRSYGQQDTSNFLRTAKSYNAKRAWLIGISGVTIYSGVMVGLNSLWYKDYPRSNFHFFNDNKGWLQQDKVGHLYTAYFTGKWGLEVLKWAGVKNKKAIWIGGSLGSVFLTSIEILDGFSAEWGASPGDLIANTSGSLLMIGQELIWEEQRILVKFSFHPPNYEAIAEKRAENLYGSTFREQLIKDYNGQTFWLSWNVYSFIRSTSKFPKWLNISLGYGAENMLGAESNLVAEKSIVVENYSQFHRERQYYLSLDIDLTRIRTKSQILRTLFGFITILKIPAPALEINSQGKLQFHPIYY